MDALGVAEILGLSHRNSVSAYLRRYPHDASASDRSWAWTSSALEPLSDREMGVYPAEPSETVSPRGAASPGRVMPLPGDTAVATLEGLRCIPGG